MTMYNIFFMQPFGVMLIAKEKKYTISGIDISILKTLFADHQLIILRGFEDFKDDEAFSEYCALWGDISLWPFGKILNLTESANPHDHIFDHTYIPLHWDGMYRPYIPEYQIFRCIKSPLSGQGGRTIFSHTHHVLLNTSNELINQWSQITGIYTRKMDYYDSQTISPIIMKHPYKNKLIIRYQEPPDETRHFVNIPAIEFIGLKEDALMLFHQTLQASLYHISHCYAHTWHDADILIADNFTLLHGREAFVSGSPRHLQRIHVLSTVPVYNTELVYSR
jgi:L-tyrosine isonitrile desaturase/decarboxylase